MAEHDRIIRIYNPNLDIVNTFRSCAQQVSIGSGTQADLQLTLPSLEWEHLLVDFKGAVTALGSDVFVDGMPLPKNATAAITDESLVRVHSIVLGIYTGGGDRVQRVSHILAEGRKALLRPLPHLKISHCGCTIQEELGPLDEAAPSIAGAMPAVVMAESFVDGDMATAYASLAGPIAGLDPADNCKRMKYNMPEDTADLTRQVINETKEEIMNDLNLEPKLDVVEAYITRKIDNINGDINDVINKTPDISIRKQENHDLGKIVIEKDLLETAKSEIASAITEDDATLDAFKRNISDNIKEEMRETMNVLVQDEVKETIDGAVSACLRNPSITDAIAETVAGKMGGMGEDGGRPDEKMLPEEAAFPADTEKDIVVKKEGPKKLPSPVKRAGVSIIKEVQSSPEEDVPAKKGKKAKKEETPSRPVRRAAGKKEENKQDSSATEETKGRPGRKQKGAVQERRTASKKAAKK